MIECPVEVQIKIFEIQCDIFIFLNPILDIFIKFGGCKLGVKTHLL